MTRARQFLLSAFLVAFLFALAGCGGGGGGGGSQDPPVVYEPNYINSLENLNHWRRLPVKVYFNLQNNWTTVYPADLPANAAYSWNIPGRQAFFQVVSSSSAADLVVYSVNNAPSDWGPDTQGQCDSTYDASQNLMAPGTFVTVVVTDRHSGNLISSSYMGTVIAHELGHALGIDGHSPYSDDLMYGNASATVVPQARDLNTAMTAYQAYFGLGKAPRGVPEAVIDPSKLVHRTIE